MLSRVTSAALQGIDASLVAVEVDAARGLPCFNIVGLPDAAVRESRDRVKTAVLNSGFDFPMNRRLTANLAPAHIRKEGAGFDLPLALGVLASTGTIDPSRLEGCLFTGELSLDGSLRPVRGALSVALEARRRGLPCLALPRANAAEAALVAGIDIVPLDDLLQAVDWLRKGLRPKETPVANPNMPGAMPRVDVDLQGIKGQAHVKRALEVAAAGGHNLLMIGPPGSGKTLLARALAGILPDMQSSESLEVTQVYSAAGLLPGGQSLVTTRPFRAPHHTVSAAGLAGGGAIPRPGELSLAHFGVLFLDELPEFKRGALEVLRQPLEEGRVLISRARATFDFPGRCMVAAAMNPCPCGHLGDPRKDCACTPPQIARYLSRLSGPLLDRLDIHVNVPALPFEQLAAPLEGEASGTVRARVNAARTVQISRLGASSGGTHCNAQMGPTQIREHCALDGDSLALLKTAVERLGLSARGFDRLLKVARTVADLDEKKRIEVRHLAEAIQYRGLDRVAP